jgi:hypothetical protein
MSEARLTADLWVRAHIRRAELLGLAAVVVRRGDATAGAVLLKLRRRDGSSVVLARASAPDGTAAWRRATGPDPIPEADADDYLQRQGGYDADVWVVEIEDPDGAFVLDDPIL